MTSWVNFTIVSMMHSLDKNSNIPFLIQCDPGIPLSRAKAQVTRDVDASTATQAKMNMATRREVKPVAKPLSSRTNTK